MVAVAELAIGEHPGGNFFECVKWCESARRKGLMEFRGRDLEVRGKGVNTFSNFFFQFLL